MTVREVMDIELTVGTPPHGRLGHTPEYLIATAGDAPAAAGPGGHRGAPTCPPVQHWLKRSLILKR